MTTEDIVALAISSLNFEDFKTKLAILQRFEEFQEEQLDNEYDPRAGMNHMGQD